MSGVPVEAVSTCEFKSVLIFYHFSKFTIAFSILMTTYNLLQSIIIPIPEDVLILHESYCKSVCFHLKPPSPLL